MYSWESFISVTLFLSFFFNKEEYVRIVCDQIEELNENIVIHRLTGDGAEEDLIAPLWTF